MPTPLSESLARCGSANVIFRIESRISFCAAAAARAAAPLARFNEGLDGSKAHPGNTDEAIESSSSKINDPSYGVGGVIEEDCVDGRCFELVLIQRRSQPEVLD